MTKVQGSMFFCIMQYDAVMITGTYKSLLLLTTDNLLVRCIV